MAACASDHQARVRDLQTAFFADDLEPPSCSNTWPDDRLLSWFAAGGKDGDEQLSSFLSQRNCHDLLGVLLDGGVYTLDALVSVDLKGIPGLHVGPRSRLSPHITAELKDRARRRLELEELREQSEQEAAFRLRVAVFNAGDAMMEDHLNPGLLFDPPPLPSGDFVEISHARGELGGRLWPCASLLARYLGGTDPALIGSGRTLVDQCTCLEIGAGCGLVGLYVACTGVARQVVLTDRFGDGALEEALLRSAELNRHRRPPTTRVQVAELDLNDPSHVAGVAALADGGGYTLVVGSDITYSGLAFLFTALVDAIARTMHPRHGVALLAHEVRLSPERPLAADGGDPALADLRRCAEAAGLEWSIVYDERPRHAMACSGMKCIVALRWPAKRAGRQP